MYACLAVTCHLHFWQNDRDFLRATVVTRGWNGYRNKSQHRKSTLEKKILPPFQQGFEPATFQSRVRCCAKPSYIRPAAPDMPSTLLSFWVWRVFTTNMVMAGVGVGGGNARAMIDRKQSRLRKKPNTSMGCFPSHTHSIRQKSHLLLHELKHWFTTCFPQTLP